MARSHVLVPSAGTIKLATYQYTDGANVKDDELTVIGEQFLPSYIANFNAGGAPVTTVTANSHLIQIMAGASNKVRVRRVEVYQSAMATAAAIANFAIVRLTTAGTGGTAQGVIALDTGDAAAGATAMSLPTVKGTEGPGVWYGSAYFMQTIGASAQLNEPILVVDFDRLRFKPLLIAAGTTIGIAVKILTAIAGATVWVNVWLDESPY